MKLLKDVYLVAAGFFRYGHPTDCNVYLVDGGEELVLIDAGSGFGAKSIYARIIEEGLEPSKVKYVINTHSHWDHARGSKSLRDLFSCKIAVHENGLNVFRTGSFLGPSNLRPAPVKVDLKLRDGDTVHAGRYDFDIIHTPGHTQDSICIHLQQDDKRILFSGDVAMAQGKPGITTAETDFLAYQKSLERLIGLNVDVLLPGHGVFVLSDASEQINWLYNKLKDKWEELFTISSYYNVYPSGELARHPEWLDQQ